MNHSSSFSSDLARLKNRILEDNPNMTAFEKKVLDFYLEVQELRWNEPERMQSIIDHVEEMKRRGWIQETTKPKSSRKKKKKLESHSASALENGPTPE